jgi:transposase
MRVVRVRKTYTDAFKSDALRLIRRGDRTYLQLGADLGVSHWTLRDWYKVDEMSKRSKKKERVLPAPAEETPEEKVARLERALSLLQSENDSLRMDREILKKAAAFFAKESE